MEALASIAERLSAGNPSLNVRLVYGSRGKNVQVNRGNALLTQRVEVFDTCI